LFKRLVKDIFIYSLTDFLFKAIAFFIFPIYTHIFSVSDFGLLNLILTIVGVLSLFINCGISNSIQRFYHDPNTLDSEKPTIVTNGILIVFFWSILILCLSILVAYLFSNYFLLKYNISFSVIFVAILSTFPAVLINITVDIIRLHFKPWNYVILSFVQNLSGVLFGLILIYYYKLGILGYFQGILLASLFALPLSFWIIRKDLKLQINKTWLLKLFNYGYPFIFAGFGYWIFESIDRWMLASYRNNSEVGFFSIASKFSTILLFLNQAFSRAWSPQAIKLMKDYPESYKEKFSSLFTIWFSILVVTGVVISLFAKEGIMFFTPPSYWDSYTPTIFLSFSMVLYGTTQFTALGISIKNRTDLFAKITWLIAIFNISLNVYFIPKYGASGSTFVILLSYLLLTILYLFFTQKLLYIPFEFKKIFTLLFVIFLTIIFSFFFIKTKSSITIILIKILYLITIIFLLNRKKILELNRFINYFK
jgi:O-antigen/teichoic acid export membrane protein